MRYRNFKHNSGFLSANHFEILKCQNLIIKRNFQKSRLIREYIVILMKPVK